MPAADLDLVLQLAVTDADLAQLERTTARLRARCASCPWQMWGPSSPVLPSAGAKSGPEAEASGAAMRPTERLDEQKPWRGEEDSAAAAACLRREALTR
jgi:hypothetical protein